MRPYKIKALGIRPFALKAKAYDFQGIRPLNFRAIGPLLNILLLSAAFGSQPINPVASNLQEAKREACESPTAPAADSEDDVQKIQENNNNNQSELEQQNSEEVTPPKNQGLIKVMIPGKHENFRKFQTRVIFISTLTAFFYQISKESPLIWSNK